MGGMEGIAAVAGGLNMVSNHRQAQAQAQAQTDAINRQNQLAVQQQQVEAKHKRDLLKAQSASLRARLAAGGGGGSGGSAEALLTGLARRTEESIGQDYDALLARQVQPKRVNDPAGAMVDTLNKGNQAWNVLKPLF